MSDFLEAKGLCKGFKSGTERIEVLADLNLHLASGEMLAVMGASGSGKSTLLHLLGGMDRPDRGSILVDSVDVTGLEAPQRSQFRNRTIGFVFQFHHLLPEFTACENVMMPLLLRGESMEAAEEKARSILADVQMQDRLHHRPGELSGGEQQRVAIARALVGRPKLLLADEPTGNLDSHTALAIGRLLRTLHEANHLTSILVTHNEKLAAICTRNSHLEDGKLSH
jgi:lipoprotein-releasing system ATP-binding protein